MSFVALVLSGGGSKGDFEVGVVRYLSDHNIVPNIVCSTSVGSVSALKVAEGPSGIPGLESAWLSLLGNGDMYGRESWTTDSDIEGTILSAATALLSAPPTSANVNDIVSLQTMATDIEITSDPATGETDFSWIDTATVIRIAGFLPIAGQAMGILLGATVGTLEKALNIIKTQVSIFNLNPLEARVRTQLNQTAIAAWAANGNRLRMATVGLASGNLRFVTESGEMTERDGYTPAYDTETADTQIRTTLLTGMLASASIPVVFGAVPIADDLYVDGGIRCVLPTEVAAQLGATQIYGVQASVRDTGRRPELKNAKLLDIAMRSLMDITINEIAYADSNRVGNWGNNVTTTFVQPRIDIHDSFTVYPAFVRNRMAYGYMCAADIIDPQPPGPGIGETAADEISIIRTAIARLECFLEGRPIPPTMIQMSRATLSISGAVIADIKTLKGRVHDQVKARIANNNAMPPTDTSWSDHRQWWQNWERHPLYQETAPPNKHICAVSCTSNRLDAFIVSQAGTILQATWRPFSREGWEGWYQVVQGRSAPGSVMAATARHDGSIDLIVAGTDGSIFSAQWDQSIADSEGWPGWHGFSTITTGKTVVGASVAVVSRRPEFLDAFIANPDGTIWTAAADPSSPSWKGWWQIGTLRSTPGGRITAVSRALDNIDIFVANSGGTVEWSHWDPTSPGGWTAFVPPVGADIQPGQPIAAVSRSNGLIDLFITNLAGQILTAGFDPSTGWGGWWQIGNLIVPVGSEIGAVSAQTDSLDIFVVDIKGLVQSSHWDPTQAGGWSAWTNILPGFLTPGTPITAVSRAPGFIDIFCIGNDGIALTGGRGPSGGWGGFWRLTATVPVNPLAPTSPS
jgi:NTE family protein